MPSKAEYKNYKNETKYVPTKEVAPTYVAPDAYQSQYADQMNSYMDKITNREEFQYNPLEDASYQALSNIYNKRGEQAAKNTMGDAAMLNGGFGSSYAVTAAQQARNDYNQELASLIPQLEQNAYQRYKDNYDMNLSAYNTLQSADESAYGRYRDTVADTQWQYDTNYTKYRDAVADADADYARRYQQRNDNIANKQWVKEYNLSLYTAKKGSSSGGGRSGGGSGSGSSGTNLEQMWNDANKDNSNSKVQERGPNKTISNPYMLYSPKWYEWNKKYGN